MNKKYGGAKLRTNVSQIQTAVKPRSNMSTTVSTDILQKMKQHAANHKVPLSRLTDEAFLMFLEEYGE